MKANDKKKLSPLKEADLPAGDCRAGLCINAVIQGRPAAVPRPPMAAIAGGGVNVG